MFRNVSKLINEGNVNDSIGIMLCKKPTLYKIAFSQLNKSFKGEMPQFLPASTIGTKQ